MYSFFQENKTANLTFAVNEILNLSILLKKKRVVVGVVGKNVRRTLDKTEKDFCSHSKAIVNHKLKCGSSENNRKRRKRQQNYED